MPGSQTAAHWHSIMSRPKSNAACGGMGPHPGLLRSLHAQHAAALTFRRQALVRLHGALDKPPCSVNEDIWGSAACVQIWNEAVGQLTSRSCHANHIDSCIAQKGANAVHACSCKECMLIACPCRALRARCACHAHSCELMSQHELFLGSACHALPCMRLRAAPPHARVEQRGHAALVHRGAAAPATGGVVAARRRLHRQRLVAPGHQVGAARVAPAHLPRPLGAAHHVLVEAGHVHTRSVVCLCPCLLLTEKHRYTRYAT